MSDKEDKSFENLKVGDIVWTIQTGYAMVTSVTAGISYPIVVQEWASYTKEGKWGCRDEFNSLYFDNPFRVEEDAYPKWMWVCNDANTAWVKRFVLNEYKGYYHSSATAHDHTLVWKYAKKYAPKVTLTMQDIADKFELDINNIEIV